jgi:hypothetical protein
MHHRDNASCLPLIVAAGGCPAAGNPLEQLVGVSHAHVVALLLLLLLLLAVVAPP